MSELSFKCPKCRVELTVDESAAGAAANCPQCGESVVIPLLTRPNSVRGDDRNINISLGFGGREKRQVLKPSRKLIYALVGVWVAASIASILGGLLFGYSIGQDNGYQRGQTRGQQTGYQAGQNAGYQEGFAAGGKDALQKAREQGYTEGYTTGRAEGESAGYTVGRQQGQTEGYTTGRAEGESAGYTVGRQQGQTEGKETALSALRKINISTGTEAEEVRRYLGTPDTVERYDTGKYSSIPDQAPCWVYGSVRIYFDGDNDYDTVIKWTGDLKALLDKKLGRQP